MDEHACLRPLQESSCAEDKTTEAQRATEEEVTILCVLCASVVKENSHPS